jgi:hypothetical protein
MDTWESLVEVKHGSTTLVTRGEPMWAPVAINGQQAVQVIQLLRAAGVEAQPRGNESNVLTFSICKEHAGVEAAAKAMFAFPISLPRTMEDVTVKFADNSGVRLKNAAVQGWSGGQEDQLGRHGVTITGGTLESISAP